MLKNGTKIGYERRLSSGSNACEDGEEKNVNVVDEESKEFDQEEENVTPRFKMARFLSGLLSYSMLRGFSRGSSS